MTTTQRDRAIKKVQIAMDKLIDLQDMGFGGDETERALDILRSLLSKFQSA